jgi:polysaccharide deacetylase family protein (PEP-CTERM system associated)
MSLRNAFTVDVEDYYHVSAFESCVDRSQWDGYESRVAANTERLLDLLGSRGVYGTFFVLGWVAERFPQLVRRIHAYGHEIGSHGYWHRLIYQLTPEQFREDLLRGRKAVEDAIDAPVVAYRAPSFSITRKSLWALDVLAEEGFRFDSSIFPIHHDRYGIPGAPPAIHRIDRPAGAIWEFPVSVARLGPLNVPVSGGGYFRLYPLSWTMRLLSSINEKQGRPFVFYVHPWELDPAQPRLPVRSRLSRWRHYVNLASTETKLDLLLKRFSFGRLSEVIGTAAAAQTVAVGAS